MGSAFRPWLLIIVRNLSIDLIRARQRTAHLQAKNNSQDDNSTIQPGDQVLYGELWSALSRLETDQQEIIFLKDYQGHSYAQIAEILGIPKGTVMSRLHYARRRLANQLLGCHHEM